MLVGPNINSVRPNINTGRTNVNSVRPRVNTGSSKVNTVRSRQPVPTRTSNSFSPKRPQDHPLNRNGHIEVYLIVDAMVTGLVNKVPGNDFEVFQGGSVTFGGSQRFSWVFFLATKDETSGILQNFIRQIENQLNHRVKTIRSDNGTEFKNRNMLEFCGNKGIKQEEQLPELPAK
ncbi:putative ribonuclease H-like domain-containing protein [Tanacetum coccineum]